jgi:hypothetical protein
LPITSELEKSRQVLLEPKAPAGIPPTGMRKSSNTESMGDINKRDRQRQSAREYRIGSSV